MHSFRPARLASLTRSIRTGLFLAAIGFVPVFGLTAHAADEKPAAAAPAEAMRVEFSPLLKAFDELTKAKDFKGALAKLAEMDAIPNKTPYEEFTIERMRVSTASSAGDNVQTGISLEKTLASGRLPANEQLIFMQALASIKFQSNDFAKAIEWIDRYTKAGGNDPKMRYLYIQSLYSSKDYTKTISELRSEIKAEIAAGKAPNEDNLKIFLNCMVNLNDKAGYIEAMQQLTTYYPKKEYWDELLTRYAASTANAERFLASYYRLKIKMGLMTSAEEYLEMGDFLMRAAQPGETKRALDQGYAAGILGKGDTKKQNALRDKVNKAAQDDLKTLDQAETSFAKAKEGTGLINVGYALVIAGKADKGIALMEQGLKLPIKKLDEARLLTGIAYSEVGRKEDALKMFALVQSNDGGTELAKYWIMHTNKPLAK